VLVDNRAPCGQPGPRHPELSVSRSTLDSGGRRPWGDLVPAGAGVRWRGVWSRCLHTMPVFGGGGGLYGRRTHASATLRTGPYGQAGACPTGCPPPPPNLSTVKALWGFPDGVAFQVEDPFAMQGSSARWRPGRLPEPARCCERRVTGVEPGSTGDLVSRWGGHAGGVCPCPEMCFVRVGWSSGPCLVS